MNWLIYPPYNIEQVSEGMGLDKRISPEFLQPGPGFGGSCFPKDTLALASDAAGRASPLRVLEAVTASNNNRLDLITQRLKSILGGNLFGAKIAVLGLAFKANTDDFRQSPAISIIKALLQSGATIRAYDPQVSIEEVQQIIDAKICTSVEECVVDCDCIFIATEWDEFKHIDFDLLSHQVSHQVIFDARNLFPQTHFEGTNWQYESLGRSSTGRNFS